MALRRMVLTLPLLFLEVLILMGDKIVSFHTLLKVLILRGVPKGFR